MQINYNEYGYGYEGEDNSRIIEISVEPELTNKEIYLEFEKPNGNKYVSDQLTLTIGENQYGECDFYLTSELLDEVGYLKMQVIAKGTLFKKKSSVYKYYVACSLNATEQIAEDNPSIFDKLDVIVTGGDGNSYLANNGEYKPFSEISGIDSISVNGVNIPADANDNVNIEVPTQTSELTNDSDFVSDENYVHTDNNYSNEEKAKFNTKADDLSYSNNVLQLKSNNVLIGTPITIEAGGGFEELNGTAENPIYFINLETGNYILNGNYKPSADAYISGTGEDTFIQVYRNETKVDVYFTDVHYSRLELYEVTIETGEFTRTNVPMNEIAIHKKPNDENTAYLVAGMEDQNLVENSVPQTSMIMLIFPTEIPIGFTSKVVFKTGATLPSFTCATTVLWNINGTYSNTITLEPNKIYTMEFEKDVFDLVGKVTTRD